MDCSDQTLRFVAGSYQETVELAQRMGAQLQGGEVIAFTGGLGAGKTAFTRGLAIGLGAGDVASSPTFAIVNEYQGRLVLEHFDMYRIESWDDLYSTGFFDYLDTDRVLAVEWSENVEAALPEGAVFVDLQPGSRDSERIITIRGWKGGDLHDGFGN